MAEQKLEDGTEAAAMCLGANRNNTVQDSRIVLVCSIYESMNDGI